MKPLFPGLPVKMLALFLLVLVIPLKAAISKEKSHKAICNALTVSAEPGDVDMAQHTGLRANYVNHL